MLYNKGYQSTFRSTYSKLLQTFFASLIDSVVLESVAESRKLNFIVNLRDKVQEIEREFEDYLEEQFRNLVIHADFINTKERSP